MIVVNQHDWALAARLPGDGVAKALVDGPVSPPVFLTEGWLHEGDVAQGPKSLIGETVIIAVLFFIRKPHPPQCVAWFGWGNAKPVVRIDGFPVRAAAAMRNPRAAACLHHRLKGGHQSAGGDLKFDPVIGTVVNIGLPIGDGDDIRSREFVPDQSAKPFRAPYRLLVIHFGAAGTEAPERLKEFGGWQIAAGVIRFEVPGGCRLGEGASQFAQPPPDNDQRRQGAQGGADQDDAANNEREIGARPGVALFGVTHAIQGDQLSFSAGRWNGERGDDHLASADEQRGETLGFGARHLLAGKAWRHPLCGKLKPACLVAKPNGDNTFVLRHILEKLSNRLSLPSGEKLRQGWADGVENLLRAQLDAAP